MAINYKIFTSQLTILSKMN